VLMVAVLVLLVAGMRLWFQASRNARRARDGRPTVAFFHPYCNAGGGRERVLWCAIRALQNRYVKGHLQYIQVFLGFLCLYEQDSESEGETGDWVVDERE